MVKYSITIVYPTQAIHKTVDLPDGESPLNEVNTIISREFGLSRKDILSINVTKMFDY